MAAGEAEGEPLRADARRNRDALVAAAAAVFARSGVDAPVAEIAGRAGVGIGTVCRRFSRRSDLIVAVFRREVDACAEAAAVPLAEHRPREALARWIDRHGPDRHEAGLGLGAAFRRARLELLPLALASGISSIPLSLRAASRDQVTPPDRDLL